MSEERNSVYQNSQSVTKKRLLPDRGNPRELEFSKAWQQEVDRGILFSLLTEPCSSADEGAYLSVHYGYQRRPIGDPTDRDYQIAETVVQWLGSNCGFAFVSEVMRNCGYSIVRETNGNQP